jgi:hypothetical protein
MAGLKDTSACKDGPRPMCNAAGNFSADVQGRGHGNTTRVGADGEYSVTLPRAYIR